jgi:hypothetical protein
LKKTLHHLPAVVQNLLKEAIDPGLVAILPSEQSNPSITLSIRQNSTDDVKMGSLASPSDALTVAIVDRTSDADAAARAIWTSRTAYGATSPYAPDVIFVNEFSKKHFVDSLLDQCLKKHDAYPVRPKDASVDLLREGCNSIASGAWGQVIELTSRYVFSR